MVVLIRDDDVTVHWVDPDPAGEDTRKVFGTPVAALPEWLGAFCGSNGIARYDRQQHARRQQYRRGLSQRSPNSLSHPHASLPVLGGALPVTRQVAQCSIPMSYPRLYRNVSELVKELLDIS
jgi:hypothetical protein